MEELFLYQKKTLQEIRMYAPITLAYIGDAVYELLVRAMLLNEKTLPTYVLSKKSKHYVSASAQSKLFDKIEPILNEVELEFFKRGRNAKVSTVPKNMTIADYKKATGFEAVFGYLYLLGDHDRIKELFFEIIKE